MKKTVILLALVAGLAGGVVGAKLFMPKDGGATVRESAYDRVVRTKTLRCAYAADEPFLVIHTGEAKPISGVFYDALNEMGKRLGLKVEWTEEVGYGNINAGFMTGRYDAFCGGLWPAASRATTTLFSVPLMYDPVSVWVRGDDHRFDGALARLNDPAYKIAITDGDATVTMAAGLFPRAGRVTMTQNQSIGEEVAQVTTGKADAMFRDYLRAKTILEGAPGSIRDIVPGNPPLLYPLTIGYNQGEASLKSMLDVALTEMIGDGTLASIIKTDLGDKAGMVMQAKTAYSPYQ